MGEAKLEERVLSFLLQNKEKVKFLGDDGRR